MFGETGARVLAMSGSLFGVGLIVGWLLAWFMMADGQTKAKDK